jgi:hypothetical protein
MRVQDIAATISGELSAEHSRQSQTGDHFSPGILSTTRQKMSGMADLFDQLSPVVNQISVAESKEEEQRLEGEAERITGDALATARSLVGDMEEMSRIVDIEVEFLRIKLNPLILDLENNVIRTGSASVATASREYLEAVKEYNYGFSSNVDRFKREREAHDRLQIAVGEALEAGPFTDYEL